MPILEPLAARLGTASLRWSARFGAQPPTNPDPLGPTTQDPEAVRAAACRLVADPRVCTASKPATVTRPSTAPFVDFLGVLLWTALAAAVVFGLVALVRAWGGRSQRRSGDDANDRIDAAREELGSVAIDRSCEPSDWRAEGERHRRAGRYRDALRCRYRALVGDLARRGLIDEFPGRTTGEERAQLGRVLPAARSPFDRAADIFDAAWFGGAEVGERDDDVLAALEREVLAAPPPAAYGRR